MHSSTRAKSRRASASTADSANVGLLSLGLIAGGLALLAHGISKSGNQRPRLIVGGVDLSGVDLSLPFCIDLSVPRESTVVTKQHAIHRLRHAMSELRRWQPMWLAHSEVDVIEGRLVLIVTPTTAAAEPALWLWNAQASRTR